MFNGFRGAMGGGFAQFNLLLQDSPIPLSQVRQ
jgi:hypothetical protein